MNNIYTNSKLRYRFLSITFILVGCFCAANAASVDSIGTKVVNGRTMIIHKLTPKETYYGLGRHYNVPVKQLIAANNNKPLKVGDTLYVPLTAMAVADATTQDSGDTSTAAENTTIPNLSPDEYTVYKVGKGETLAIVSKRFRISTGTIKRANGITDDTDSLEEGALIKVPNEELPPVTRSVTLSDIISDDESTAVSPAPELPANRYGIREMTEKGIGVWIEDLNQAGGNMLALHKTAPVGTVVKITNPMTNRTTFAKVVGKFTDTAETKDAIIVISKSAANLIGVLDRRFQVEIAYGTPNESSD